MTATGPAPFSHNVQHDSPAPPGRRLPIAGIVFSVLALVTLGFQAVYVFLPTAGVIRPDSYDARAHYLYFDWIRQHADSPLAFRWSYVWVHFPSFYQWNLFVTQVVCRFVGEDCLTVGLKVAWFLQAVLRVGTLALLLATYRRLFRSPAVAAATLALCATSPRVFFATCIWNQNDYVFFFAALVMYVTVASIQEGLAPLRIVMAALATALGFHMKLTMIVPTAAMLFAFLLLPLRRASLARKAATFVLVAVTLVAVNASILATSDGRARLNWSMNDFYSGFHQNAEDLRGAYLTLSPGPILRPEKIFVPITPGDWVGHASAATGIYLYAFELYDHFQGPPRTWLNLLCVWSGTPLLALVFWRAARALRGLLHPATMALDEVYCATLVVLGFASLCIYSLNFPFGWAPHPEYVLASYGAAAVLLVRQACAFRSRVLVGVVTVVIGLHMVANLASLVRTADYKMDVAKRTVFVRSE